MPSLRSTDLIGVSFFILEWLDFELDPYRPGDSLDVDLWDYLYLGFDGTIIRDTTSDVFPDGISIEDDRYLRGRFSETGEFRIRLIASEYGVMETSGELLIVVQDILSTDQDGNALFTDQDGNALSVA